MIDKETVAINIEKRNITAFVHSEEYKAVKNILLNSISELHSILDISDAVIANPNQLAIELQARKLTIQKLTAFIEAVEGTAAEGYPDMGVTREHFIVRN